MIAGFAPSVRAQDSIPWPAANRLSVKVSVESLTTRGDTLRLWYSLGNSPGSEQAIQNFAVRTFVSQYRIEGPARWHASPGVVQDSAAVLWSAVFGRPVIPGARLSGFWFEGTGLPAVVPFRVQGSYEPPKYDDSLPWLFKQAPSFWANSVAGVTIGLVPLPSDHSTVALLARLRTFADLACGDVGWIAHAGTCRSLEASLEAAASSLAGGDVPAAKGRLEAFLSELAAQHGPQPGKHVSDDAYWLLKANAEYVLRQLAGKQ